MTKPKFEIIKNLSKPKKPKLPSPRQIRGNIVKLENRIAMLQVTPLSSNVIRRNQQINLVGQMQAKVRELYIILYDLQEEGRVLIEKERKREMAWKEFMAGCSEAGYCPENKAKVDDDCEGCNFHVPVFTEKPTPDDPAVLTEEEIIEVIKNHDDPDTTLQVILHPDHAKRILKEKK